MFPPKEIAQNLAMGLGPVQRLAARRHNTGLLSQPRHAERTAAWFASHLPRGLSGMRILELGPGQGVELARVASAAGARYSAFDVKPYLTPEQVEGADVDYRVDRKGELPWAAASFDVVWSHSVLEHVHDPPAVLAQVEAVLKPGGHHIAWIDLETHSGGRGDPPRMYEFLRYPPWLWRAMTSNRSTYVNRLRVSEWREAFTQAGLVVVDEEDHHAGCSLGSLRQVGYLSELADEDLLTCQVLMVARKPGEDVPAPR